MKRTAVESSQIHSVGYDPATQNLEIQFIDRKNKIPGAIYQYSNVPEVVYKGLMDAPSVGSYFGQIVKGVYAYTKIS